MMRRLAGDSHDQDRPASPADRVNPEVPCIEGTRIPVALILRYLGDGRSVDDILEAFPGLTVEDIRAAAAFAADVVADEAVALEDA